MPCSGYEYDPIEEHRRMKNEIDNLTRLLCEVCRTNLMPEEIAVFPELAAWWNEHQRLDAERERVAQKKKEKQAAQARAREEEQELHERRELQRLKEKYEPT